MEYDDYEIGEHTHRYACWAAARAASRGRFANTEINSFIVNSKVRKNFEVFKEAENYSFESYKDWFIVQVNLLLSQMKTFKHPKKEDALRNISFGVAAKVISTYVKTVEVLPTSGKSKISFVAIPPIDSYLLRGVKGHISKDHIPWSKMDKDQYMALVEELKDVIKNNPFWTIEYYWNLNEKTIETSNV